MFESPIVPPSLTEEMPPPVVQGDPPAGESPSNSFQDYEDESPPNSLELSAPWKAAKRQLIPMAAALAPEILIPDPAFSARRSGRSHSRAKALPSPQASPRSDSDMSDGSEAVGERRSISKEMDDGPLWPQAPMQVLLPRAYPQQLPKPGGRETPCDCDYHLASGGVAPPKVRCTGPGQAVITWEVPLTNLSSATWQLKIRRRGDGAGWRMIDLDSGRIGPLEAKAAGWKYRGFLAQPGLKVLSYRLVSGKKSESTYPGTILSHSPGVVVVDFQGKDGASLQQRVPQDWVLHALPASADLEEAVLGGSPSSPPRLQREAQDKKRVMDSRRTVIWRRSLEDLVPGTRMAIQCAMEEEVSPENSASPLHGQRSQALTQTWWPVCVPAVPASFEESQPAAAWGRQQSPEHITPEELFSDETVAVEMEPWPRIQVVPVEWLCEEFEDALKAARNLCADQEIIAHYIASDFPDSVFQHPKAQEPGDITYVLGNAMARRDSFRARSMASGSGEVGSLHLSSSVGPDEDGHEVSHRRSSSQLLPEDCSPKLRGKRRDSSPMGRDWNMSPSNSLSPVRRRSKPTAALMTPTLSQDTRRSERAVRGRVLRTLVSPEKVVLEVRCPTKDLTVPLTWVHMIHGDGNRKKAGGKVRMKIADWRIICGDNGDQPRAIAFQGPIEGPWDEQVQLSPGAKVAVFDGRGGLQIGMLRRLRIKVSHLEVCFVGPTARDARVSSQSVSTRLDRDRPTWAHRPEIVVHDFPADLKEVEVSLGALEESFQEGVESIVWSEPSASCKILEPVKRLMPPLTPAMLPDGVSRAELRWVLHGEQAVVCSRVRWREAGKDDWFYLDPSGMIRGFDTDFAYHNRLIPLAEGVWASAYVHQDGRKSPTPVPVRVTQVDDQSDDVTVALQEPTLEEIRVDLLGIAGARRALPREALDILAAGISKQECTELKSLQSLGPVERVLDAVCHLLVEDEDVQSVSAAPLQSRGHKMLAMPGFIKALQNFKSRADAGKVSADSFAAARGVREKAGSDFSPERIKAKSRAAASLCLWAAAAIDYVDCGSSPGGIADGSLEPAARDGAAEPATGAANHSFALDKEQTIPSSWIEAVWVADGQHFFKGRPLLTFNPSQSAVFAPVHGGYAVQIGDHPEDMEDLLPDVVAPEEWVKAAPASANDGTRDIQVGSIVVHGLRAERRYQAQVQALTWKGWTPWSPVGSLEMPRIGYEKEELANEKSANAYYSANLLPYALFKEYDKCRETIEESLPADRFSRLMALVRKGDGHQAYNIDASLKLIDPDGPIRQSNKLAEHDARASIRMLVSTGHADVNYRDQATGRMPLTYACEYGRQVKPGILEELLSLRADVDSRNDARETALSLASARGHDHLVEVLLAHGADTNIVDMRGQTALLSAQLLHRSSGVERLGIQRCRSLLKASRRPYEEFEERLRSAPNPVEAARRFLEIAFPDVGIHGMWSEEKGVKRISKHDRLRLREQILEADGSGDHEEVGRRGQFCAEMLLTQLRAASLQELENKECAPFSRYLLNSGVMRWCQQEAHEVATQLLTHFESHLTLQRDELKMLRTLTEHAETFTGMMGAERKPRFNGRILHQWHAHDSLPWLTEHNVVGAFEALLRSGAVDCLEDFCSWVGELNALIGSSDKDSNVKPGAWDKRLPNLFWGSVYMKFLAGEASRCAPLFHQIAEKLVGFVGGRVNYKPAPNKSSSRVVTKQVEYASSALTILHEALDHTSGRFKRVLRADLPQPGFKDVSDAEPSSGASNLAMSRRLTASACLTKASPATLVLASVSPPDRLEDAVEAVIYATREPEEKEKKTEAASKTPSKAPSSFRASRRGSKVVGAGPNKAQLTVGSRNPSKQAGARSGVPSPANTPLASRDPSPSASPGSRPASGRNSLPVNPTYNSEEGEKPRSNRRLSLPVTPLEAIPGLLAQTSTPTPKQSSILVFLLAEKTDSPEDIEEAKQKLLSAGADAVVIHQGGSIELEDSRSKLESGYREAQEKRGLPVASRTPLDARKAQLLFETRKCCTGDADDLLCCGGCLDLVRGSITCNTEEEVMRLHARALTLTIENDHAEVVRVKNGFHTPAVGGYCDLKLFLVIATDSKPTGAAGADSGGGVFHICELQVHLKEFLECKKYTHMPYCIDRGDFDEK